MIVTVAMVFFQASEYFYQWMFPEKEVFANSLIMPSYYNIT